ncbi:MAG: Alkaline phosphatase synthesis transcriptional regulatory protein PhoP [Anaerolineae bacterium]|nr:Alkaline phosphatase synthesis transcriptional regulatory protein PhoP [Anaerolineae bacterium]
MNRPRILIIDDEANIRFVLENALKHEGYSVESAANGAEALNRMAETPIDLLLLDLQMEPVDGLTVLHQARQRDPNLVVIILTAYGSVESAVEALRLGAFDYLFKPTTPQIIRERVAEGLAQRKKLLHQLSLLNQLEVLRQSLATLDNDLSPAPPPPGQRFIHAGPLVIDQHHRQATLNDHLLELTTTEFDLLVCLVKASPQPVSARQLVACGMGHTSSDVEAKELVKWHIHHLRRKIEPQPAKPRYIKTVRHQGYLWINQ